MELKIQGLKKIFEGNYGEPSFRLDLPDLSFDAGEVVFLMGENGSGKTITLRLIAGELLPSSESVLITYKDKKWQADKHPIPVVRQKAEQSLALDLTVEENLLIRFSHFSFYDKLFPSHKLKNKIDEVLSDYKELKRKKSQPCLNLSGGQRQTLAFLCATVNTFPILLLDEFLAATDSLTSSLLRIMAKKYAEHSPACVLIVSHNVDTALQDADKILLIKEGKLLRILTKENEDWNKSFLINFLNGK